MAHTCLEQVLKHTCMFQVVLLRYALQVNTEDEGLQCLGVLNTVSDGFLNTDEI